MGECFTCPYYTELRREKIYCEIAIIKAPDLMTRSLYSKTYCAHPRDYKSCTLYKALEDYYERKYKNEVIE